MLGEKRWIILTPDGGQVSIGRHTDPSDDEIEGAAGKLRQAGTGGWFAVMEGGYYGRRKVTLLMVREIVPATRRSENRQETTLPPFCRGLGFFPRRESKYHALPMPQSESRR